MMDPYGKLGKDLRIELESTIISEDVNAEVAMRARALMVKILAAIPDPEEKQNGMRKDEAIREIISVRIEDTEIPPDVPYMYISFKVGNRYRLTKDLRELGGRIEEAVIIWDSDYHSADLQIEMLFEI